MPGKDRQRQLAREKVQRQMAKRAEQARRRRRFQAIAGSVVAVIAVVALCAFGATRIASNNDMKKPKPAAQASASATPTASAAPTAPQGCAYGKTTAQAGPVPRKVSPPSVKNVVKTGTVKVLLKTNRGDLSLTLDRTNAPCTVNSFVSLVKQKYFDKTPCHRLTTTGLFVLQCGDPGGTGGGGPGYAFADEGLPPAGQTASVAYPAATIAMANSGPGTNGSQFFIVYKDSQLPPNYTVFGRLTKGLDVVQTIAKAGSTAEAGGNTKPNKPVQIQSARIVG